jgi:hypothetical protein
MTRIWTRTRRYMAVLWLGTIALEGVVLVLAARTNNSWVLLLGLALLVIPIAAMDATWRWFGREPRKRWKRHDLEDALAAHSASGRVSLPPVDPRAP